MTHSSSSRPVRDVLRAAPARDLPTSDLAARQARHDVLRWLKDWRLTSIIDDAALVVSELVANAVRAGGAVRLVLQVVVIDVRPALRIEVTDHGPALPPSAVSAAMPDENATSGRGLPLIDLLCADWGSRRTAGRNELWAHLTIGPAGDLPSAL